jgi:hypothetical protein
MAERADRSWRRVLLLSGTLVLGLGCGEETTAPPVKRTATGKEHQKQTPTEGKRIPVGQNVWLEVLPDKTRRVLVSSRICLRQGPLELLLTRRGQKEHESILTADVDARKIHEALLLANAQPGSPVRFGPRYRPATGTPIKLSLIYEEGNRKVMVSARSWVRNVKTQQELESDWVFAGSHLVDEVNPLDPQSKPAKKYLANGGDVICVANFEEALLDLPIQSSKDDADRSYEAWTERIPPAPPQTKDPSVKGDQEIEEVVVLVVLEPVLKKKNQVPRAEGHP